MPEPWQATLAEVGVALRRIGRLQRAIASGSNPDYPKLLVGGGPFQKKATAIPT